MTTSTADGKQSLNTLVQSAHYSDLIKELTCSKCERYMRPPIRLCVDGHSMCAACYKTSYQCHVCEKELSPVRSLVLESLANKVLFPCIQRGCPRHLLLSHLERHIAQCPYRLISCFMARVYGECDWKGCAGDWLDHCSSQHSERVANSPIIVVKDKFDPNRVEPIRNYFLLKCFDNVFNAYQIYSRKEGKMMWTVLVNDEKPERFYYEVDIFLPDIPCKRIIYRRPCKCEKDADILQQTQNVLIPLENLLPMRDEKEYFHFTIRIGEADNLTLLDTPASSASHIEEVKEEQKDNEQ